MQFVSNQAHLQHVRYGRARGDRLLQMPPRPIAHPNLAGAAVCMQALECAPRGVAQLPIGRRALHGVG